MDVTWTEAILSMGIGIGLAAATGMRVFLPLLILGTAARFEWLPLSDGFQWLSSGPAIAALAIATIFEIAAFYIPWLDNALDLVAGPMAVVAGIMATAAVTTELPPVLRWSIAIIAGGGTAGVVQSVSSILRLKSTALTAGFGNFVLSSFELVGAFAVSILAILAPVVAIIAVIGFLFFAYWASRGILRRVASNIPS